MPWQHQKQLKNFQSADRAYLHYILDLLFFLSAAVISLILFANNKNNFYIPFPEQDLYRLEGTILSDSKKIDTGKYIHSIGIYEIKSVKKITVLTDHDLRILSKGNGFEWGDTVTVTGMVGISPGLFSGTVSLKEKGERDFYRLRRGIKKYIDRKMKLIESEDGLTRALITGDRSGLEKSDSDKFRRSGCSHMLALSGMHLGIISFFFFIIIKPIAGQRKTLVIINMINIFYLLISGISASLLRAVILSLVLSYASFRGRKTPLIRSLFLTFLINIFINPGFINDLSFQYSYLALAGIVIYAKPVYRILLPYLSPFLALPVSCSVSALLFTSLLSASVFGEIFLSGIAASFLITPVMTLFMWSSLLSLFVTFVLNISYLNQVFLNINSFLSGIIISIADFFSGFPPVRFESNISLGLLIVFNISVIIVFTLPDPGLKIFKRYR